MQVASRAAESRKPVILAINKIDAVQTVAVLVLGSGLVSGCHDLTNYVIRNTGILTSRNQRVVFFPYGPPSSTILLQACHRVAIFRQCAFLLFEGTPISLCCVNRHMGSIWGVEVHIRGSENSKNSFSDELGVTMYYFVILLIMIYCAMVCSFIRLFYFEKYVFCIFLKMALYGVVFMKSSARSSKLWVCVAPNHRSVATSPAETEAVEQFYRVRLGPSVIAGQRVASGPQFCFLFRSCMFLFQRNHTRDFYIY